MPESLENALESLPHGAEFRFIDHLLSLDPGKAGTADYRIRGDEPFLRGHFPGDPLFPGVLLLEAGAQLAGVIAQNDPVAGKIPGLRLAAIRSVKISSTAKPGETIHIEARITHRIGPLVQAEITLAAGPRLLLTGQVTLGGPQG